MTIIPDLANLRNWTSLPEEWLSLLRNVRNAPLHLNGEKKCIYPPSSSFIDKCIINKWIIQYWPVLFNVKKNSIVHHIKKCWIYFNLFHLEANNFSLVDRSASTVSLPFAASRFCSQVKSSKGDDCVAVLSTAALRIHINLYLYSLFCERKEKIILIKTLIFL